MTKLLDASAVLAFMLDEPGGDVVRELLLNSLVLAPNWSEIAQKTTLRRPADASNLLASLITAGIEVEPLWREDAERAADIWRSSPSLSLADRCCLAAAVRLEVPVFTADAEWVTTELDIDVQLIR